MSKAPTSQSPILEAKKALELKIYAPRAYALLGLKLRSNETQRFVRISPVWIK